LVYAAPVCNDEEKDTSVNIEETAGEVGIRTGSLV
jgi:hypothetical protein